MQPRPADWRRHNRRYGEDVFGGAGAPLAGAGADAAGSAPLIDYGVRGDAAREPDRDPGSAPARAARTA